MTTVAPFPAENEVALAPQSGVHTLPHRHDDLDDQAKEANIHDVRGRLGRATGPEAAGAREAQLLAYRLQIEELLRDPLSAELNRKVKAYLSLLDNRNGGHLFSPETLQYLEQYLVELMAERDTRADEVESKEVGEAADIANRLLPHPPYGLLCVDGRVHMTGKYGLFARVVGGSMRLPAGDPKEFIEGEDGGLVLLKKSSMARGLREAYAKHDKIAEILDSHLRCAARVAEESDAGHEPEDEGLLADVKRKKAVAKAMRAFSEQNFPGKKLFPIQGSFDPHTGFAFAGLETDGALAYAEANGGFTEKALGTLADSGTIVSTQRLADEFKERFENEWKQFNSAPDWRTRYKETALQIWKAMERMKPDLLPVIQKKIAGFSTDGITIDPAELEMRAMLLLANAFNGFCNNHVSDKNPKGEYRDHEHDESFLSVSKKDHGPFEKFTAFGVYDDDVESLAHNVVFAAGIVRKNRRAGRVALPPGYSLSDFVSAPVVVVVKEIFREKMMPEEWDKIRNIHWDFLQKIDWFTMHDADFLEHLSQANPDIKISLQMGMVIQRLFQKMKLLYNPRGVSSRQILKGGLVVVPVICDKSRRFQVLVPAQKHGFPKDF